MGRSFIVARGFPEEHRVKRLIGLAVLAAVACSDPPAGPVPRDVTSVTITSPQTVLVVGSTVTLTANAFDAAGAMIPGLAASWSSNTPSTATVSQSGVVTGVAVGTATIEAEISCKVGSVSLTVDPDPCTTPIELGAGQLRVLSGPAAVSCITLAATSGPTDFLFVTANADQAQDNKAVYAVALDLADLASATRSVGAMVFDPRVFLAEEAIRQADAIEQRVRQQERRLFAEIRPGFRGVVVENEPAAARQVAAAVAAEGDTLVYRVPDVNGTNLCTTGFREIRAVVKRVGSKVTIVQDITSPAAGFTSGDFASIAAEFDGLIYPTDTLYFGRETDRNADGRVTILYTPEVNKATPSGAGGFVAGFFWGGDLVKKTEYAQLGRECPQTNEQEIFYMLVPDPAGTINGNPRSVSLVRQNTRGTIAHEFQHMINHGLRLFNPAVDSSETTWLNEGLSHFAEEVVGRALRGFGDFQKLDWNDVNPTPQSQDDYNAWFRQNLGRYRPWMERPDTSSPTSSRAATQLAPRGAAWMFLRYTADHHGGGNLKAFLRGVVAGPDIGLRNLLQHSNGAQYDDLLSGWLVSQFTDGVNIPGLPARLSMKSWAVRDLMSGFNNGVFPLQVTPLPASVSTQSISGSGNYFRLTRLTASPGTTFRMVSPGGSNVGFAGARVYVVRIS
jgi:hypothetical protein